MNCIPEDNLPDEFKDETRKNVLYAPLRSKSVNPKDWNTKVVAWSRLINLYCTFNNVYCFTSESLKKAFNQNGRSPSCLNEVLEHMRGNGDVQEKEEFLWNRNNTSWKQWASSSLLWPINRMRSFMKTSNDNIEYIPIKVLEQVGDELLNEVSGNYRDKIVSLKEFLIKEKKLLHKAKDYEYLFTSLSYRGKVSILVLKSEGTDEVENFLFKFNNNCKSSQISESDLVIYNLERKERLLQETVESLEDNIQTCVEEAKKHLSRNHKLLAKSSLRKRNEMEKNLQKKVDILHNIQVILQKLEDNKMNMEIWQSYEQTLKSFNMLSKQGVTEEVVDDTVLKIKEMLEIQSDIDHTLAVPIIDEDLYLEEELDNLMKEMDDQKTATVSAEQKLSESMENLNLNLPDVPASDVSIGKQDISGVMNITNS